MAKFFNNANDINKPEINLESVHNFFDTRAKKAKKLGYKSAVMYQDKNPELVNRRDKAEKEVILPKLKLHKNDYCLDIGCGTGRWADALYPLIKKYHGIDFSNELINIAKSRLNKVSNTQFSQIKCEELNFNSLNEDEHFNKILCFGVLMYLNDIDLVNVLNGVIDCASDNCLFLLREPIGINQRLTIAEHFSTDMEQIYNAIYRTKEEIISICENILIPAGFKLMQSGDVFSDNHLNNRQETKQHWFLFMREK